MINKWHTWLDMPKFDKAWHEQDMADELAEYHEETVLLKKWSELSDVTYTCTRGRWSGYDIKFPFGRWQFYVGTLYMVPKYTGRWLFYRSAGKKSGARHHVHEVRNPRKVHKLHVMAKENGIDEHVFERICKAQLRYWPLLP